LYNAWRDDYVVDGPEVAGRVSDRFLANACKTGIKKSVMTVETSKPPITALAKGIFASLPSPNPSAIGARPQMVANDVIKMGRMR
jgi:hypothetical protein